MTNIFVSKLHIRIELIQNINSMIKRNLKIKSMPDAQLFHIPDWCMNKNFYEARGCTIGFSFLG